MENNGNGRKPLDLNLVRERLARTDGKQFWKSFEELADTAEFQEFLQDEFPRQARTWGIHIDRRDFLHLMGASLALAGMSGCRFLPDAHIIPYVKQPEEEVPGMALFFASAFVHCGYATGVLVESHEGRPTKIEGNPDHPASLGSTDQFAQASTLNFYDPDRSTNVLRLGELATFDAFLADAREVLGRTKGGAGVAILTESFTSPTLKTQFDAFLKKYPKAKWHVYDPVGRDNVHEGMRLAFGQPLNPVYHFDKADVVVSLDADIFGDMPGCVRYARDFMDRRRVHDDETSMNRLYHVETTPLITGVVADHSAPLRQFELEGFARALAARLQVDTGGSATAPAAVTGWMDPLVKDLQGARTKSIVIPGEHQSPAVHALAQAMNTMLGNVGSTVTYTDLVEHRPDGYTTGVDSLRDLTNDLNTDKIDLMLIFGGNPAYNAPNDIPFAAALKRYSDTGLAGDTPRRLSAHVSLHVDETSVLAQYHINGLHPLETWGDARAFEGTTSVVQPLIQPLYGGKSDIDVIAALLAEPGSSAPSPAYDLVRARWKSHAGGADYEKWWRTVLNNGVIPNTVAPVVTPTLKSGFASTLAPAPQAGNGLDIVFRADPTLHDGRFANNGWLMELPKPITRVTWDNCAYISPKTAVDLNVISENQIELLYGGKKLTAPVWVIPGQPDNTVTVHLGFGRERAGQVGNHVGFNAYMLRPSSSLWFGSGASATVAPGNYGIACVEHHWNIDTKAGTPDVTGVATLNDKAPWDNERVDPNMDPRHPNELVIDTQQDRGIIHFGTIDEYRAQRKEMQAKPADERHVLWKEDEEDSKKELSLYDDAAKTDHLYEGYGAYAWGMSIDLNVCTGCQACVVACEAENNTPVIGKEQVARGREMQWIRIDRYYRGKSIETPEVYFQPLMCVHCENAPCEPVCPVAATVHSHEGLNQMVYNRCVGTRYCSNNCPYKVRRFNFLNYANHHEARVDGEYMSGLSLHLMQNPNVTVRGRGVMEKCSYCVQRINAARIEAKKQEREIRDGEVVTACQQACPTRAIVFGNIHDPKAAVTKLKAQEHAYDLLAELNTRPRTSYLAKLTNPNPEIKTE